MNGSLIIDEVSAPEIHIDTVRDTLLHLCRDDTMRRQQIAAGVQEIARRYKTALQHKAEFWLLLAIALEIAYPESMQRREISAHRKKARSCKDATEELFVQYGELRVELLKRRSRLSNARMSETLRCKYQRATEIAQEELKR